MTQFARLFLVALVVTSAMPMSAAPYDMVLAGEDVGPCILSASFSRAEWRPFWAEQPTGIYMVAAAPHERVFAIERNDIVELHADKSRTPFYSFEDVSTRQLVIDESGDVFVVTQRGANTAIVALSPEGNLTATYPLPFSPDLSWSGFDLAADQCTAFIAANGVIHRFNVCTGTPLSDFANVPANDLAVLPGGGLLVAYLHELRRYDAAGALTNTIAFRESINAFTLRRGGDHALLQIGDCGSSELREVNLLTAESFPLDTYTDVSAPRSIIAADTWTAAIGATTVEVPTLTMWMLMALAGALPALAIMRLR